LIINDSLLLRELKGIFAYITALETTATSNATVIAALETQVTVLETTATSNATEIATLETQVTVLEATATSNATEIAALQAEVALLEQRPTLAEVQDGRPGSVVLSVDPAGNSVTLDFTVEESEDLITWTPVAGPGVSQTLSLPEGKRFYRFAH